MIKVNNIIKFYTVLLLIKGKRHGYEIIKELEASLGRKISASHVYPFLEDLRKEGYVSFKESRGKKVYSLTKEGRSFINSCLNRCGSLFEIAIKPRLSVCAHCGCKVYEGGHSERVKGRMLKFCCLHCAGSYKKIM